MTSCRKQTPDHIKQTTNIATGKSEYYCTICKKSFGSRTQKYYHYGCATNELKKHKCSQCEKSFSTRSHLNYHLESHNSRKYNCTIVECGKTFTNRVVLQKHLKLHDLKSPFLCDVCEKQFRSKETLNTHILRHKNELNFECEVCKNKYFTKSALAQHKLKHFAKKYKCPHCAKRFQRNSILSRHLKRHTETEYYICTLCSKNFSDASALHRHAKMHTKGSVISYKCIQCDIMTVRKDNMRRHVRNMHLGENFSQCVQTILPEQINSISNGETESIVTNETASERNSPKTVPNSSVIKCIGNVEPVTVPNEELANCEALPEPIESEPVLEPIHESPRRHKKFKKKYDPIEMYRKILTSDEKDFDNDDTQQAIDNEDPEKLTVEKQSAQQRSTTLNTSNFSETHWRKNTIYNYQHQEY